LKENRPKHAHWLARPRKKNGNSREKKKAGVLSPAFIRKAGNEVTQPAAQ